MFVYFTKYQMTNKHKEYEDEQHHVSPRNPKLKEPRVSHPLPELKIDTLKDEG